MAHLEEILGSEVIGQDGSVVPVRSLTDFDLIGIYFSAHWCPPCKKFTPILTECYQKVKDAGNSWEVVFVSLDNDEPSCLEYFQQMPWLLLPYDSPLREPMSDKFGLVGIPALLFIDPKTGKKITDEGRTIVTADRDGFNFPWQ